MKTADRLGYKAGKLNSKVNLVEMELCRLSGRRATAGCREAKTAYDDQVPADIALPENDLCPLHPAKAQAVDESTLATAEAARAVPVIESTPLKALPVPEAEQEEDIPLKAIPVE